MAPRVRLVAASVTLSLAGAAACSSGDGTDLAVAPTTTAAAPTDDTSIEGDGPPTVEPSRPGTSGPAPTSAAAGETSVPTDTESTTASTGSVTVDETGVPGLDADDAFCRSWSRFGGSFQVVAVNAAFGSGSVLRVATLEVVAAPTTASAYADMSLAWPDELSGEADPALDEVYGPFARRLAAGRAALLEAGATSADLAAIDDAWVNALATRRPDDPDVIIDLPDELWDLVDLAAPSYLDVVGPWADDDSLVTSTEIPLTSRYLADNCPDQGVLAGQEVTGGP